MRNAILTLMPILFGLLAAHADPAAFYEGLTMARLRGSAATPEPPVESFGVTTWSTYTEATITNMHAIPTPSGVQVGDLLLLVTKQSSSTQAITNGPAGWTFGNSGYMPYAWKVAESGDTASTLTFTLAAARQMQAMMLRISGARSSEPIAFAGNVFSYDPVHLSPSGWGTGDYLGITFVANRRNSSEITAGPTPPTSPSGFSLGAIHPAIDSGSAVNMWLAFASGTFAGISALNPNTWSLTTPTNDQHGVLTILVRP